MAGIQWLYDDIFMEHDESKTNNWDDGEFQDSPPLIQH